jgi:photosystem II stability/assembly factor-like uncharacterized protein
MTVCLSPNGVSVSEGGAPPEKLLVGTANGIACLERRHGDEAWELARHALEGEHISSLLVEPERGGLFAGTYAHGLFVSDDGGHAWRESLTSPHEVYTVAARKRNGGLTLYVGTEPAHLFCSDDYGQQWQDLPALRAVPDVDTWTFPAPPHAAHVKSLALDPRDSETMYACVEQGALLKTEDGGHSWRELSGYARPDDVNYKDIHRLVLCPSHPDLMYMTTGEGLYRSEDGGESWEHLTRRDGRVGYPDGLALSPRDPNVVFMAGAANSPDFWRESHHANACVVRSHDAGRTWEVVQRGMPENMRANIEALSLHAWPSGYTVFVATTDGDVFASQDEGEYWTRIASGLAPISKSGHYRKLR